MRVCRAPPRILTPARTGGRTPTYGQPGPANNGSKDESHAVETRPSFASTWIVRESCRKDHVVARYRVGDVGVTILSPPGSSTGTYLVDPPEYRMNPRQLLVLNEAIRALRGFVPNAGQVRSLSMMRAHVKRIAMDQIHAILSARRDEDSRYLESEADMLSEILCRYTAGYGILETLLSDDLVQDIYVDAPSNRTPVQVVLRSAASEGVRQKCRTNVLVGRQDMDAFVSRMKLETGLPFSEARPVMEAEIEHLASRVTLVSPPLSDRGVSLAVRRHSGTMWSMPALVANGTISAVLAGFLWACAAGRRAVLIAGSRGAGKTSLLNATMLEFPVSQRILLIEDTPEIPVARMQALGYDIQTLRFAAGGPGARRAGAGDALRVSLRMGESAIVIGEVRGEEARVLYESMRAGSAGSAVLGTIHGNSARGVLDRAVEDLGVSERAFSSTDLVVMIGLMRSPEGVRFCRKVTEVAEVREDGHTVHLASLFEMDAGLGHAEPTEEFTHSCATVKGIAGAMSRRPQEVMDLVRARARAYEVMGEAYLSEGDRDRERRRAAANERLDALILAPGDPLDGLETWMRWYDGQRP